MRLFLVPVFVAFAVAACADLKTAEPAGDPTPATSTDPAEAAPSPTPAANAVTPPPAVVPGTVGSPIGGENGGQDGNDSTSPSSDAGPALTPLSVDDVCEPYCTWRDRCPGTGTLTHAECVGHCHGEWAARIPHFDRRYITYVKACFPQLTCTKSDDTCFSNYAVVDPDPVNVPEVKACLALVETCGDVPSGPSKSTCYAITALDQATRTAAAQCFALECSVVRKCVTNTWGGD